MVLIFNSEGEPFLGVNKICYFAAETFYNVKIDDFTNNSTGLIFYVNLSTARAVHIPLMQN